MYTHRMNEGIYMTQCACGSHDTDVVTSYLEYEYKGYVQTVERSYTECQNCGLEFQVVDQINAYAMQIREAEFTIDQWILDEQEE